MDIIQKVIVLRNSKIFEELTAETLLAIAEELEERDISEGEVIYNEGDPSDYLYIVVSGEVSLSHKQNLVLTYKEKDFFGLIALLDDSPYMATATAASSGLLLSLDKVAFNRITDDLPEVIIAVNQILIHYLMTLLKDKYIKQNN